MTISVRPMSKTQTTISISLFFDIRTAKTSQSSQTDQLPRHKHLLCLTYHITQARLQNQGRKLRSIKHQNPFTRIYKPRIRYQWNNLLRVVEARRCQAPTQRAGYTSLHRPHCRGYWHRLWRFITSLAQHRAPAQLTWRLAYDVHNTYDHYLQTIVLIRYLYYINVILYLYIMNSERSQHRECFSRNCLF